MSDIEQPKYVLHVTVKVNLSNPHDVFSVILPVPDEIVEEAPAPLLAKTTEVGSRIREAVEGGITRRVFDMDRHEYQRKIRRGDSVPEMPKWEVAGFALMTLSHVAADPYAYRRVAEVYGFKEATDATD